MAIKEGIRTGGRSARVQKAIHAAVRELLQEHDRASISVPLIAQRAGVTPSTIYRRWGDLTTLLADAAVERLRPDEPVDRGTLRDDLRAWGEAYLDDMSSPAGREMMRDVIACGTAVCSEKCATLIRGQLQTMLERAVERGEYAPNADDLVDNLVSPIIYRVLYAEAPPSLERVYRAIDQCLAHR